VRTAAKSTPRRAAMSKAYFGGQIGRVHPTTARHPSSAFGSWLGGSMTTGPSACVTSYIVADPRSSPAKTPRLRLRTTAASRYASISTVAGGPSTATPMTFASPASGADPSTRRRCARSGRSSRCLPRGLTTHINTVGTPQSSHPSHSRTSHPLWTSPRRGLKVPPHPDSPFQWQHRPGLRPWCRPHRRAQHSSRIALRAAGRRRSPA
jgi:hypothetical protein